MENKGIKALNKSAAVLASIFLLSWVQVVFAQAPSGETIIADGIKASFNVTPSQNMVDLLLTDVKTGKAITEAKVSARIKGPDGKAYDKKLLGMKMGEKLSYMNTLDMAKKGSYSFDILVEIGKKKVKFNFVYEMKQ